MSRYRKIIQKDFERRDNVRKMLRALKILHPSDILCHLNEWLTSKGLVHIDSIALRTDQEFEGIAADGTLAFYGNADLGRMHAVAEDETQLDYPLDEAPWPIKPIVSDPATLLQILRYLPSLTDRLSLRQVCKDWRTVLSNNDIWMQYISALQEIAPSVDLCQIWPNVALWTTLAQFAFVHFSTVPEKAYIHYFQALCPNKNYQLAAFYCGALSFGLTGKTPRYIHDHDATGAPTVEYVLGPYYKQWKFDGFSVAKFIEGRGGEHPITDWPEAVHKFLRAHNFAL